MKARLDSIERPHSVPEPEKIGAAAFRAALAAIRYAEHRLASPA